MLLPIGFFSLSIASYQNYRNDEQVRQRLMPAHSLDNAISSLDTPTTVVGADLGSGNVISNVEAKMKRLKRKLGTTLLPQRGSDDLDHLIDQASPLSS